MAPSAWFGGLRKEGCRQLILECGFRVVWWCFASRLPGCFAHTQSSPSPPTHTYQVLLQWSAGTALMCIFWKNHWGVLNALIPCIHASEARVPLVEKRKGKTELKDIKMIDASEGGDISDMRGAAKGWLQLPNFKFGWLTEQRKWWFRDGKVQWNRDTQTQISDIPRKHKISFLLRPLENTCFPNSNL